MVGSFNRTSSAGKYIFGLGATGIEVLGLARRLDHLDDQEGRIPMLDYRLTENAGSGLLEGSWSQSNLLLMDTSVDLYARLDEATSRGWVRGDERIYLSTIADGASRNPPVAEFVGEQALNTFLGSEIEQFKLTETMFLVHSAGGGTGSGLAPYLAQWVRANNMAAKRISIVTYGDGRGGADNDIEIQNAIYNFPRINRVMDNVVLIDNRVIWQKRFNSRFQNSLEHYVENISNQIFKERTDFNQEDAYLLADRYAYRILSALVRLPSDAGDNFTFFHGDERYSQGKKWLVPFIYPVHTDYELHHQKLPPAYMALRALTDGNLCNLSGDKVDPNSRVLVIFESSPEYDRSKYNGQIIGDVQKVISETLGVNMGNIRLVKEPSRENGVAIYIFVLGARTDFLDTWCDTDPDEILRAEQHWRGRMLARSDDIVEASDIANARNHRIAAANELRSHEPCEVCANSELSGLWERVCVQLDRFANSSDALRHQAKIKACHSASLSIYGEFFKYARNVGLIASAPPVSPPPPPPVQVEPAPVPDPVSRPTPNPAPPIETNLFPKMISYDRGL